jgi:hypothetical protein
LRAGARMLNECWDLKEEMKKSGENCRMKSFIICQLRGLHGCDYELYEILMCDAV